MKEYALVLLFALPLQLLSQCGESGDTLIVDSPEALTAISGCSSISGSLMISDPNFTHLDELSGLESVEEQLILDGNISLQSIEGLSDLSAVGGDLVMLSNFTLQSLSGLSALASVGGSMTIDGNITLISLDGLSGLTSLGGDATFRDNHVLEDVSALSGLSNLNGDLTLDLENFILNDLDGLSALESIAGDVLIELPALTGIGDGFASLNSIEGDLWMRNMQLLGTLNGMESLQVIGDSLKLENNDSMVSINGLVALDEIGGAAIIEDNNALLLCCTMENWDVGNVVQGELVLTDNHPTCNNLESVLENCEPLSVWESEPEFVPGVYLVSVYELSGRLISQGSTYLSHPTAIQPQVSGLHVVRAFHEGTGFALPARLLFPGN